MIGNFVGTKLRDVRDRDTGFDIDVVVARADSHNGPAAFHAVSGLRIYLCRTHENDIRIGTERSYLIAPRAIGGFEYRATLIQQPMHGFIRRMLLGIG